MHAMLANSLLGLNRFTEAKSVIHNALRMGLDSSLLHTILFEIAFVEDDVSAITQQLQWFAEHSDDDDDNALETETAVALYSGRLKLARQKRQLLSELRSSYGRTEAAGTIATDEAIVEAEFGYLPHAQKLVTKLSGKRKTNVLINAALLSSITGKTHEARSPH